MMYLQLSDPELIRKLNTKWLALADEIIDQKDFSSTANKMQESKIQLDNIEQEVKKWFFGT